ncbi:MAG TPA: amidohydrolase [Lentimicrobium sp.]|jgi:predicted amidohydrolase|nr:amidohydrolase [Lentimicrobium sp.]
MKPTDSLRVTIVQAPLVWAGKVQNLEYFSRVLEAIGEEPDLVVLPEMFATGFLMDPETVAEPVNGSVIQWMADQAAQLGCVITGSVAIIEKGRFFNRLVWMRPDGSWSYTDKRHLFRMGNEHQYFQAGSNPLIEELKGWKIKPLICYDLRFPVWSKNRIIDGAYEYDLLIYVANWPASRSYVWKTLLTARAIENQAYCIGVNRIGDDGKGIPHNGSSMVLDFKGRLMLEAPVNEPFTGTATLDFSELEAFRERFAVGLDWDTFTIE